MLSVFWLVPSCIYVKSLREFDLASSSLESTTATAPLVSLPSCYLYVAFRSGSYNMPIWTNLPWKTMLCRPMCPALLPNLALPTQEGNVQDILSRVTEQVGWRTMCLNCDTVCCHRKSIELRPEGLIWILTLPLMAEEMNLDKSLNYMT